MISERKVAVSPSGDIEILLTLPGGTYQLVWERSYGKGVFNPDGTIEELVKGQIKVPRESHKLLFGTHLNGACPADCKGCPFARSVMKEYKVLARPINPQELYEALNVAKEIALDKSIIKPDDEFSAGALLSGDPGHSLFATGLIAVVSTFPHCKSSRWSTIAPSTGRKNVYDSFLAGATIAKSANSDHVLSFQTSLHSTDPQKRVDHTGVTHLLPVMVVSQAAMEIFKTTGRKMTMAFVLHEGSVIDPVKLKEQIPVAIASLRAMKTEEHPLMNPQDQIKLYRNFRNAGWDVVFMPPSPDALELDNMRTRLK